jgi:surface protein
MSSFGDLKDYSNETIEFNDLRPATVLFEKPQPFDIELTSEDLTFDVENPYTILEIVNVDIAQPFFSVDVSFFPGTIVSWPVIPQGLTVTESAGVYSIGPFEDIETYELIKTPTITIPEEFQGVFFYSPSIDYTTDAGAESYIWQVGVFVPVSQLSAEFEINAQPLKVKDSGVINLEAFASKLTIFSKKEELEATLEINFNLEVDFDVRKDLTQLKVKSELVAKPRFTYPLLNTTVDPTHPDWRTTEGARLEYEFIPNVGIVTDVGPLESMTRMFRGEFSGSRKTFNDISVTGWDVSTVKTMDFAFLNTTFNRQIGNWDVSSVTNMNNMFRESLFNQPINSWNVSSVTNMKEMFFFTPFNQPIDSWDVSSVTDMSNMFRRAVTFNQPLNNWDVSSVTDMNNMFSNIGSVINPTPQTPRMVFNQPLNNWDVSSVTNMENMFIQTVFNQPLNNWDVSSVTNMTRMFRQSNFDQNIGNLITNLANQPTQFSFDSPIENKPTFKPFLADGITRINT